MTLYTITLLLHGSGAVGACVCLGIWLFGHTALRRVRQPPAGAFHGQADHCRFAPHGAYTTAPPGNDAGGRSVPENDPSRKGRW